jgi:TatD DNase family protein
MVDSHTHIQLISKSPEEVIKNAKAEGVNFILCCGIGVDDSGKILEFSNFDNVFLACGIHPLQQQDFDKVEEIEEIIKKNHDSKKVVAIGETGLDFFKGDNPDLQIKIFEKHVEIAEKLKKPVVVHTRGSYKGNSAFSIALDILSQSKVKAVFHCFTWGKDEMKSATEKGFFISFSGILTFSNDIQDVAKETPLEYILTETDAPFLTPKPFRGKRENEPAFVKYVVEKIAQIKNIDFSDASRVVEDNFKKLFLSA